LLASVSLNNKNGCKCQHYDYAYDYASSKSLQIHKL
jgi:hypothetical protein